MEAKTSKNVEEIVKDAGKAYKTYDHKDVLAKLLLRPEKYQKKSILFVLRNICKHDPQIAEVVIKAGGLHVFVLSMEDFEPAIKEAAAWGVGYIARHNSQLAQACVDAGALPLLMLCLQEPEISLKQICTNAVSDIAKQSEELAQNVVDAGIVPHLTKNLNNSDEKLKRQTLCALSSCAKHSEELAEVVVEAEIFPTILLLLSHSCYMVRRNAACLVRDIVKHSLELTQFVVNSGGVGALIEILHDHHNTEHGIEDVRIPCITALGFIAGHSSLLALTVIGCKTVAVLAQFTKESSNQDLLAVSAWTLGQIGKHSPEHAQAIAGANVFPRLVELYVAASSTEDLKHKCKICLKLCLQKCLLPAALEPLLYDSPPDILKYILGQYSKILPNDPKSRRLFVTSGCLKKIQEIGAKPGTALKEYITVINSCFPEELVRYYSPGYPETLLEKVEQYSPQMMTVLRETDISTSENQTDDILRKAEELSSTDDSLPITDTMQSPDK